MPLEKISSSLALRQCKSPHAKWPVSRFDKRLSPYVAPCFEPSFQIEGDDKIFCMGSCFARNIETALSRLGFDCITARAINPYAVGEWAKNNFLIRYNPFSMLNELKWALDLAHPFPNEGYLPAHGTLWTDPHNHAHYEPHPLDRLKDLRRLVQTNTQQVHSCRIFILTLGLIEAWYDHKIGHYTNICPDFKVMQREPDRFSLHVLDVEEITQALEGIYELLTQYGHPNFKMLISTSPVPLAATFRNRDVFSANTYSKSALRTAAERFYLKHNNVDYFPSYESIILGEKKEVWDPDQRHVNQEAVRFNVTRMIQHYISPNVPNYKKLIKPFKKRNPSKISFLKKIKPLRYKIKELARSFIKK